MADIVAGRRLVRAARFDPLVSLWRLLTSVQFALGLIGFLALAGLLGTLLPQVPAGLRGNPAAVDAWLEEQRGKFGALTDALYRLGLFNVFSTPWFVVALGLLAVAVAVCTANRLWPVCRSIWRPVERRAESSYEGAANRCTLPAVEVAALERALRRRWFKVRRLQEGETTYLFADRFAWARLGTFVTHLSLVVFLAGALVSRLGGFEAPLFIAEGTTAPVFGLDHPDQMQVLVEDAVGRFDEGGSPLDYRTQLVVFQGGREVARGTATVNDPFSYGGYRFHQASYFWDGAALRVRDLASGNNLYEEVLALGDTIPAPAVAVRDASGRTLLQEVLPPTDFLDTASGTAVRLPGRDAFLWLGVRPVPGEDRWQLLVFEAGDGGEGIRLVVNEGQRETAGGLEFIFMGVPGLPSSVEAGIPGLGERALVEMSSGPDDSPYLTVLGLGGEPPLALYPDRPVEVDGREYTFLGRREFAGLEVRRDPGTKFIWIGAGLLLTGLAITFYLPRRRLWARISDERTDIIGLRERSGGFETEMRRLAERLGIRPARGGRLWRARREEE